MTERPLIPCFALVAFAIAAAAGCTAVSTVQNQPRPYRATLVGLDPVEVESRIGQPAEKTVLPDSNETYWIYKTKAGPLSVHFENAVVVDIDPAGFPVEILFR